MHHSNYLNGILFGLILVLQCEAFASADDSASVNPDDTASAAIAAVNQGDTASVATAINPDTEERGTPPLDSATAGVPQSGTVEPNTQPPPQDTTRYHEPSTTGGFHSTYILKHPPNVSAECLEKEYGGDDCEIPRMRTYYYYYEKNLRVCLPGLWTGCGTPSNNHFKTEFDCKLQCEYATPKTCTAQVEKLSTVLGTEMPNCNFTITHEEVGGACLIGQISCWPMYMLPAPDATPSY